MSPGSTEDGKAKLSKIRRAILHPKRSGGACLMDSKKIEYTVIIIAMTTLCYMY
jgi:hypothetical protein